jgi:hypothetical protein
MCDQSCVIKELAVLSFVSKLFRFCLCKQLLRGRESQDVSSVEELSL